MSIPVSDPVLLVFVVMPVVLVLMLAWGAAAAARRTGVPPQTAQQWSGSVALAGMTWMLLTFAVARSGVLHQFERRPPPFAWLVLAIIAIGCAIAFSPFGRRLATGLPLWVLIASQSFRLPLELAMDAMAGRGVMPTQMSYSGYNFDIVTGTTAIVVAVLVKTGIGGTRLAAIWNVVGMVLLINVVGIAIASTPAFAAFGPDRLNLWVFDPPFVWLPAVMVLAALTSHLVIFRALGAANRTTREQPTMQA